MPRLRFSLRLILLFVTIFCLLLAVKVIKVREQQQAVKVLGSLGGQYRYDFECDLRGNYVPNVDSPVPQWLINSFGIDYFADVAYAYPSYHSGECTDDDFALLSSLKKIRQLDLESAGLTDDGFQCLENFRQLDSLVLCDTEITDVGLANLRHLTKLRKLSLANNSHITPHGLEVLKLLVNLEDLQFDGPNVTDDFLQESSKLARINHLCIRNTSISGNGIKQLQSLSNLLWLNISESKVSDDAVEYLSAMSRLKYLKITGTNITDEGEEHLIQALPNCKIIR